LAPAQPELNLANPKMMPQIVQASSNVTDIEIEAAARPLWNELRTLKPALKALESAVEAACASAYEARPEIKGAINWADLHCAQAEFFITSNGETGYRVWISEASPDQLDLRKFIREFIDSRSDGARFESLEILFEW
jgi:hypothetical protein